MEQMEQNGTELSERNDTETEQTSSKKKQSIQNQSKKERRHIAASPFCMAEENGYKSKASPSPVTTYFPNRLGSPSGGAVTEGD